MDRDKSMNLFCMELLAEGDTCKSLPSILFSCDEVQFFEFLLSQKSTFCYFNFLNSSKICDRHFCGATYVVVHHCLSQSLTSLSIV